jgi:Ca-activated chloride channel homolog
MRFQFPWALLILPLIVLLAWYSFRRRGCAGLKFSSVGIAGSSGRTLKTRLNHLPLVIRVFAIVLLTVGLARPQQGREEVRDVTKGIAIEMVVDRSGSMGEEFVYEGRQLNRLEAVKRIFREFVLGNGKDLEGRPNDLMGMVAFARHADTICPLTLSHEALERFIESIQLVTRKNEDGTAIGDALALAAARLRNAEEQLKKDYQIKSKVVILLTDGQNNAGKRSPIEAARLAKEWGIKVYAIGIGGRESFVTVRTPLGDYKVPGGPGVDEATLKAIADETGGAFWLAESAEKLRGVYEEINRLELTDLDSVRHIDYAERFAPFVLAALALLTLELALVSTVLRRIP